MKIGLYFGSFNPIHIGHLIIASFVANNAYVDQVWFVVTPKNPFKNERALLNEYDRLHLVQLAIKDDPVLKCCDVEFKLTRPSYTIDTLTYLKEKYLHDFSIILGSDSLNNIHKWKNGMDLKKSVELIVYQRPKYLTEISQKNIIVLNAPLLEISSTIIRNLLKAKKSARYMVPEIVLKEIEKNGYYK